MSFGAAAADDTQRRHTLGQLHRNSCDEQAPAGEVTAAALEEEAGAELLPGGEVARDGARNGGTCRCQPSH